MDLLLHSIQMDWPVLLPILICSILVVAAAINRVSFYDKNKRDVVQFIPKLQKELAKKADISQSMLCDIEKGRCKPSIYTAIKLAKVLQIDDIKFFEQ